MATVSSWALTGQVAGRGSRALDAEALERRTKSVGRELFESIGRGPKPWRRAWWDDRLMNWTLEDPDVRVQLFRFIDALPALRSAGAVRRHLAEYLSEAADRIPWWLKLSVAVAAEGSQREVVLATTGPHRPPRGPAERL